MTTRLEGHDIIVNLWAL